MTSTNPFRESENSQTVDVTRRRFLAAGAAGVAGVGALGSLGSAAAASEKHLLTIQGTGSSTTYSFTVGGDLEQVTAEGATIQDNDNIVRQSAHGEVSNGKDAYTFTGPLYSFDFDQSGEIDVDLDGEPAYVGDRPDHTLLIEGTGPSTTYSFGADQIIGKSDAYGASKNSRDRFNIYGAEGEVSIGKDAYTFNGELQAFEFEGGAIEVTIDGKSAHVGQLPDQAMILFSEREYWDAEYEVTVSGSIREVLYEGQSGQRQSISERTISGWVWGGAADKFTYDGEIESFTTNDPDELEAYSNYEKLY
ncbi:pre-peptidase [Halococcus salsus]|uniref:pre-peptidase n=1 Tax=Halococcus salsus TaxID=2162894 RepID=UPI00135C5241|nr:pre-peptidase [Halococcus salsus]